MSSQPLVTNLSSFVELITLGLIYTVKDELSDCKAWGLLFTCMCTRAVHVKIVKNNFLLAFSRFTNLRRAVDAFYSDNAFTLCAAAEQLPLLINSTDLHNSLRKRNTKSGENSP